MSPSAQILVLLWVVRLTGAVLTHVQRWQTKEYRLDRMRAQLMLPSARREVLLNPLAIIEWLVLLAAVSFPSFLVVATPLLLVFYGAESLVLFRAAATRTLPRPQWTAKARGLFLAAMIAAGSGGVALAWIIPLPVALALVGRLVGLLVVLLVGALHGPSQLMKQRIMAAATRRRAANTDLTVIGITGSYGKSSTKEVLAHLLGEERTVLKTKKNTNTEIGIAQTILTALRPDHRFFVCEMAAYRRGEIRRSCDIARPTIGVLTAVGPQHRALFGSVAAVTEAKYELIAALPKDGVAIINVDNDVCRGLADRTRHCRVIRYGVRPDADVRATAPTIRWAETAFGLITADGERAATVPLLGAHVVSVALGAVAAARVALVPLDTIVERLKTVPQIPRTMEPLRMPDGTSLIDDSYSANPEGVRSALDTLAHLPFSRKVVVFTPLIELGHEASRIHEQIGHRLAEVATTVLAVSTDFAADLRRGMRTSGVGAAALEILTDPTALHRRRASLGGEGTVVLLEGRVPTRFWERVRKEAVAA